MYDYNLANKSCLAGPIIFQSNYLPTVTKPGSRTISTYRGRHDNYECVYSADSNEQH